MTSAASFRPSQRAHGRPLKEDKIKYAAILPKCGCIFLTILQAVESVEFCSDREVGETRIMFENVALGANLTSVKTLNRPNKGRNRKHYQRLF